MGVVATGEGQVNCVSDLRRRWGEGKTTINEGDKIKCYVWGVHAWGSNMHRYMYIIGHHGDL